MLSAVFLLGHGYFGFVHDNILYLAQALARLRPDIYLGDIYLAWGSQDRYTVFSPLYAWLIANFGLAGANITLVILGESLFLGASFLCVRAWVPQGTRGLAMLFIATSNGLYGAAFIFRMGEQFATPRPLVEAAVLLAIALLVSGRRVSPFVVIVLGALLHPLVALTGLLFAWLYLVLENRCWAWMIALGIIPIAAAFAGIAPFDQLLQRFDDEWLGSILMGSQHVFATAWNIYDWSLVAWDVSILYMGFRLAEGGVRRVLKSALALALVALGVSLVGADILRNVLLTNLQIWRALWLVHWVALAVLPFLLVRLWNEEATGSRLTAGVALFGFFLRGLPAGLIASILSVVLFPGRRDVGLRGPLLKGALYALAAGAFGHWLGNSLKARDRLMEQSLRPTLDFAIEALSKPFALAVAGAVVVVVLLQRSRVRAAAAVSLALLVAAVLVWDRRTPIKRYMENTPFGSHPFSQYVKPDQEVLWYEDSSAPWVLMQRRSYMSSAQGAGQMFNRETAMEYRRRRLLVNPVEFQEMFCQFMNKGNNRDDSCADDVELLIEACRDAPDLDFIVLESPRRKAWLASWTPPVEYAAYRPTYYLYACKQLAGR